MSILGSESITRVRYAVGTRGTDGRMVPGAATSTAIAASVQPASDEDMQSLPEGERRREGKRVYTVTELRTASQHAGTEADTLTIGGVSFQVRRVDRERSIIPHYRAIAIRVQE
jgi:hypothetical protein